MIRGTRKAAAAVGVLALIVVAGSGGAWLGMRRTGTGDTSAPPAPTPLATTSPAAGSQTAPKALARFYTQHLDWVPCGALRCAHLLVPLDYERPAGKTIRLRMVMRPAGDQAGKVGALLLNTGGPGERVDTAVRQASYVVGAAVLKGMDLIGLNPRGTTGSDPVSCLAPDQLDAYFAADPAPSTRSGIAAAAAWTRRWARGCARDAPLAAHVSTVEAARDMDVLRAALGQPKLDYLGYSYGTKLGTVYADLFPTRVGRFVLDGAVAPHQSVLQAALGQAQGFEDSLDAFVRQCIKDGGCLLGDTATAAKARFARILDATATTPLPAGSQTVRIGDAYIGAMQALYSPTLWPALIQALGEATRGNGAGLAVLENYYVGRSANGTYGSNVLQANVAVNCLDDPWSVRPSQVARYIPRFEKVAPELGAVFAWSLVSCAGWTLHAEQQEPPVGAPGADPIVVIGSTGDPATPYAGAVQLAHALQSGVLLTRVGQGHTSYRTGNACIDRAVEGYLVDGTVPKTGLRC